VVAFKAFQALLITNIGKIAENRGTRINVGIVLDVSLLVHQPLWSRRTAAVSCFASRRPSIYSLASARTSLLGAKFSRRRVASASRTCFSRSARRATSEDLGEVVIVLINLLPACHYFAPPSPGRLWL